MSTFRTIATSVKYHTLTRPAIALGKNSLNAGFHKLVKLNRDRRARKQGRKVGLRDAIIGKTRGATAHNRRVWGGTAAQRKSSPTTTLALMKRRKAAADAARSIPRPVRRFGPKPSTGSSSPVGAPAAKTALRSKRHVGTVSEAVGSSKTHGEVRRRITRMAVKSVTRRKLGKGGEQQRAAMIRNLRKEKPSLLKRKVRNLRTQYAGEAAKILAKKT